METVSELIPFAREMLSQRPNRKMVKIYVLGTVLAFFGVVIGLVETVCYPFGSSESESEERPPEDTLPLELRKQQRKRLEKQETAARIGVHRKHAS
uniref:G0/G1 switch protein 2 n=1 Tax=Pristiophorus japonicus TaxID=55135 RepID=UPI00398ED74B